jgi:hypothetical protein
LQPVAVPLGEDEVDGGFGDFFEDFEAVALVDAEVVFGVVESGRGRAVVEAFMLGELEMAIFPQGLKPSLGASVMSELRLRPPKADPSLRSG